MSDGKDKPQDEPSASEPQGPIGGERLAEARRAQQISVAEIAKELHLDEPKVRALERNEFDVLGAPVFAKGHLRKYAKLVRVDEQDIMADYYQLDRASTMPPVVLTRRRQRWEMSPGPWIAVIVVVIIVATGYWWFTTQPVFSGESQPESVPQQPEAQPVAEAEPAQESQPAVQPAPEPDSIDSGDDDSAVLTSASGEPDAAPEDVVQAPELGDGQMRLLVTYTGDCWTEISDARGRRLFFNLGTDGRTVELSGEEPFNVLFGNADNVRITVNGKERAISAAERRGRTARLTISGT
ncbi:MAG: DUF4115 domain-containing protein [Gammaproteobacteria bacterium]|nr:DUF4115 domain-containing protein [Gammaproteobacteria bacterium]NNC56158.1 DUF4115 domain-containing protein [Woeseiaceae bacterium]